MPEEQVQTQTAPPAPPPKELYKGLYTWIQAKIVLALNNVHDDIPHLRTYCDGQKDKHPGWDLCSSSEQSYMVRYCIERMLKSGRLVKVPVEGKKRGALYGLKHCEDCGKVVS